VDNFHPVNRLPPRISYTAHNPMAFNGFGRKRMPSQAIIAVTPPVDNPSPVNTKSSKRRPRKPKPITPDPPRTGRLTATEKSIITGLIADTPGDITPTQVEA
jgi:hypothetical protein